MQGVIGSLVTLIGDARFGKEFARFVHDDYRSDYIHILRFAAGRPQVIESISHDGTGRAGDHAAIYRDRQLWRTDAVMVDSARVSAGPPVVMVQDDNAFPDRAMRTFRTQLDLGPRAMIVGRGAGGVVGISMSWSGRSWSGGTIAAKLAAIVDLAFPVVSKHIEICDERCRPFGPIPPLAEIEADLHQAVGSTRLREAQVGARLVAGRSANQIAQELAIGRETVITHRKRLYDRLRVENGRELLLWYLRRARTDRTRSPSALIPLKGE